MPSCKSIASLLFLGVREWVREHEMRVGELKVEGA